jgi:predicted amidohydrolase YtcJ
MSRRLLAAALIATPLAAVGAPAQIFYGGDIVTMHGAAPEYVEAIVVRDGKIAYLGAKAEAVKRAGAGAEMHDLAGRALFPGFVDPHGHLIVDSLNELDANLTGAKDIPELLGRVKAQLANTPNGGWCVGMGYRPEQMAEHRFPTREELDAVSETVPIMIVDGSGHQAVINSALMRSLNITAETPDPEGGKYFRKEGSRELNGHISDEALNGLRLRRPVNSPEVTAKGIGLAVRVWESNGQTTAAEMGFGLGGSDIDIVKQAIDQKLLPIDLVLYAKASVSTDAIDAAYQVSRKYNNAVADNAGALLSARPDLNRHYINRVRLAGIKFWMDGSTDAAFMSKPYTVNPPGVTQENYVGLRTQPQDELEAIIGKYWNSGLQMAAHAIGDEANEQYLLALEKTIKAKGYQDQRPIFQHAQYIRPDQIPRIKAVHGIPSFTAGGIVMGDYVVSLIGPERAHWAMPAQDFLKAGVNFTVNTDWPAGVSPSPLVAVWGVVNRQTKSGKVLGEDERVSPYEGMRAITINAAYQIKEEGSKGSLEPGKLADMVILDRNPLKIDPRSIKDVIVLETFKEGTSVYRRPPQTAALEPRPIVDDEVHGARPERSLGPEGRKLLTALVAAANEHPTDFATEE